MTDNLTAQTLHGLKWSYASTITRAALQIGFTAIMARLLEPAAFGLVAMAGVVLRFGTYFAQMGVGSALIQKKDVTDQDIRAAFTSSVFLSILFCVIIWFSAPLAVYIFDSPKVVPIIRVMAFSFIITGLTTTALSLLRRNLRFRSLAIAEILSYVLGYGGIGIVLADNGFGVWSLVMAALSQSAFMAVFSYAFSRHKLSFIFRWKYYKPLYSFGSRISVISFFEFLGSNLDTLMIGRFVGAAPLGIYNRAFMLVNLPAQHLTSSFSRVLFPSFSRVQKEKTRLKKAYLTTIMLFSAILLPTCFGMAAASREIVLLVLGENWAAAIPVLQILAIAAPLNLLSHFGGIVCEATATLNVKLLMQIVYVCLLAILFYLIRELGIREFAMAIVFAEFIRFAGYLFIVKKICNIRAMEYVHVYLPSIVSSFIIGISIYIVAALFRGFNTPLILLFTAEVFVGAGLLIIIFLYGPQQGLRKELSERLINSGIFSLDNRFFSWFYKALSAS
jgi:O-antigen/teichoic acid export membrane protein